MSVRMGNERRLMTTARSASWRGDLSPRWTPRSGVRGERPAKLDDHSPGRSIPAAASEVRAVAGLLMLAAADVELRLTRVRVRPASLSLTWNSRKLPAVI